MLTYLFKVLRVVPALAAIASASFAQPANPTLSGSFTVSPLRVDLKQGDESAELQLTNSLDRPSAVQIRVFAWSQQDGQDRFAPTSYFTVSPSIFRMPAGALQTFHIARSVPAASTGEARYRIVIDQLPESAAVGQQFASTRLQLTLPLFSGSEMALPAKLTQKLTNNVLQITNSGGRTARIAALTVVAADGQRWPVSLDHGRYIHGQSTMSFSVPRYVCQAASSVRLTGTIDRTAFDAIPQQSCP